MSRYQHQGPPRQGPPHHGPPHQQHGPGPTTAPVLTNCFEISRVPTKTFVMYDVSFKPDIPKGSWKKRTELVHHLRVTVSPQPFHPIFLYDGGAIGFAHPAAANRLGSFRSFRVRLRDSAVPGPEDTRGVTVIEFKRTAGDPITATEINEVVRDGRDSPRRSSLLNFMQLVVRYSFNNLHANNGKAYFPQRPALIQSTVNFLELRRGIFHSVRPAINKVMIVVDTTVAAFWQSGALKDAMLAVMRRRNLRDLENLTERELAQAKKIFRGLFIREKKGDPPRLGPRRAIKGFHKDGAFYEFENGDGMTITIKEHYKRLYNITLALPELPGVILRETPERLEIVPMETCFIDPNQLYKKTLPESAAQLMVKCATLKPEDKKRAISGAAGEYSNSEGLVLAEMAVQERPLTVDGTVLPPPRVRYGDKEVFVDRGQWNLLGRKFFSTPRKCGWAILNLAATTYGNRRVDEELIPGLVKNAENLGLQVLGPFAKKAFDVGGGSTNLQGALDGLLTSVKEKLGAESYEQMTKAKLFFILCILEKEAGGPRATIKHWGDVKCGVLTQCVRVDKLNFKHQNAASQYWNNVVLKVNARLGGENSRVSGSPVYDRLTSNPSRPTMIIGSDVSHPSPGIRKPSVASLVYSHDQFALRYASITRLQDPRQEVISDLKEMMRLALSDFMMNADGPRMPVANIVFFRDGVSEGEYDKITAIEIKALNEAIQELWKTMPRQLVENWAKREHKDINDPIPLPKVTFIVVGKRHHTLMFPGAPTINDGRGNCKAGVVVNNGITQPTIRDFYLLSHAAIIGTSRSSHYIVLQDDVFGGESTAPIQELAFALCHSYAKATRSVSIPAPVYYADLACGRDAFHFEPLALENLRASDFGSVASSDAPLDLDAWKRAFRDYNKDTKRRMMFL